VFCCSEARCLWKLCRPDHTTSERPAIIINSKRALRIGSRHPSGERGALACVASVYLVWMGSRGWLC
jgi:hypothetical protein